MCYEEHNGVIEIGMDAKIVPTYSFEEIRTQIEEKWKEEIKIKLEDVNTHTTVYNFQSLKHLDSRKKKLRARTFAAEA